MCYFLWVEDFEGDVKATAGQVFGGVLDENLFAEEKRKLKNNLENHGIFIELNFQDGLSFISSDLDKVDYIILDIDLPAYGAEGINKNVLGLLKSFEGYQKHEDEAEDEARLQTACADLKKIAGFYLYTQLVVELGFPKQHILFCSNHGENTRTITEAFKTAKIELPTIYKKSDPEIQKWIKERYESPYSRLRRGIIESCHFLKSHVEKDKDNIQLRDFIKKDNNRHPVIEIETTEISNYLDTLAQFLPLREPNDKHINQQYRLFLRTLVHEWEENIDPTVITTECGYKDDKIHDIHTFAWLAKMTRNWTSHANLLEPLNPEIVTFLFLVNMRAMFKLPKAIQPYEQILLTAIPEISIDNESLKRHIEQSEKNTDEILSSLQMPKNKTSKHFGEKINDIYRQNTGNPDAEHHNFQAFLFQYFWVNQRKYLHTLTGTTDDFLPVLAHHIYKSSFPEA